MLQSWESIYSSNRNTPDHISASQHLQAGTYHLQHFKAFYILKVFWRLRDIKSENVSIISPLWGKSNDVPDSIRMLYLNIDISELEDALLLTHTADFYKSK